MATPQNTLVLVTGGSGFIGNHCIIQLLEAGYRVKTTIRSLKTEPEVRSMLEFGNAKNLSNLSFIAAELMKDDGWTEAVKDCTYVLHVASPFPMGVPKNPDDLIVPAREGTLRVLRAARDAGVKRVVLTSSFAAVGYGAKDPAPDKIFTEKDWTDTNAPVGAYVKSKTLAERAAWDFIEKEGKGMELSVINPTAVFGPILGKKYATSIEIIQRLLNGQLPMCPNIAFGVVDVRDVADMHLKAMVNPKAAGERFLCFSPPFMSVVEMSNVLRENMGKTGKRCPTRVAPDFLLRIGAFFMSDLALIVGELGKKKQASNEKAKSLLGWQPRSNEQATIAAGESLVKVGLVKGA
ncbi:hypothetical protein MMC10_006969 [Thelotrema lepadinum]|nr:hypothetical protein [Thelotrema lepadinum]